MGGVDDDTCLVTIFQDNRVSRLSPFSILLVLKMTEVWYGIVEFNVPLNTV